jgi:hypothetical protein
VAPGYEDLNDHESLRHDPVFDALLGKLTAKRERCAALAGKSTLNRSELHPAEPPTNQKPQPCHRRTAAAHCGALASAKNALPAPRPLNLPSAAHRSTCLTDESENLSGSEKWRIVARRIRCAVHELRRRRPQREPLFARNGSVRIQGELTPLAVGCSTNQTSGLRLVERTPCCNFLFACR